MRIWKSMLLISMLLLSGIINAKDFTIADLYVRATPPHTENSAAFMTINNNSDHMLKLISASSDIAERVELHNHILSDGMMKMRQVETIDIEPHAQIKLQPGSFHVMFLGLKSPLIEGKTVQFTLYFNNGNEITVDAPIKKITMQKKMNHNH